MHNAQSKMCIRRDDDSVYSAIDVDAQMIMWKKQLECESN